MCVLTCVCVCACVRVCICVCLHVCVCVCVCLCVCVCVCVLLLSVLIILCHVFLAACRLLIFNGCGGERRGWGAKRRGRRVFTVLMNVEVLFKPVAQKAAAVQTLQTALKASKLKHLLPHTCTASRPTDKQHNAVIHSIAAQESSTPRSAHSNSSRRDSALNGIFGGSWRRNYYLIFCAESEFSGLSFLQIFL